MESSKRVNAADIGEPPLLRRCVGLQVTIAEGSNPELSQLFAVPQSVDAGDQRLLVRAPHLDAPVQIDFKELELLARFGESLWQQACGEGDGEPLARLLNSGLLIERGCQRQPAQRESEVRASFWDAGALVQLRASHWHDMDYAHPETRQWQDIRDLVANFGPPPEHPPAHCPIELEAPAPLPKLAALVSRRRTARNFDEKLSISQPELSALLWAGAGELGREAMAECTDAVRRTVPSGGALHPIELWVLAQRVDHLAPGLYRHVSRQGHLDRIRSVEELPSNFAYRSLAGQTWFSNAPALFFICCNFARHLHKYRQHSKALRVLHVEAGHVAQNLYLAAAELELGCFITLAINERLIEQALGLDGVRQGVLAIAGAGKNLDRGLVPELWPEPDPSA